MRVLRIILLGLLISMAGCACGPYEDSRCPDYPMESFLQIEEGLAEMWAGPGELDLKGLTVFCVDEIPYRGESTPTWGLMDMYDLREGSEEVHIYIKKMPTLRMTAYAHELTHLGLWNGTKGQVPWTADPNHSEPGGPWTRQHDRAILKLWWFW